MEVTAATRHRIAGDHGGARDQRRARRAERYDGACTSPSRVPRGLGGGISCPTVIRRKKKVIRRWLDHERGGDP